MGKNNLKCAAPKDSQNIHEMFKKAELPTFSINNLGVDLS